MIEAAVSDSVTNTGFPALTVLWLLPLIGAGVVLALPARSYQFAKSLALAVSVAVLVVAAVLGVAFDRGGEQFQFVESHSWIPAFGTSYTLGLDGIALVLVLLTAVLVPLLLIAGWNDVPADPASPKRMPHTYFALILVVESMVMISFSALDILLFYIFFEAMLIPMYFLIGGFGGVGRSRAAVKFLLYNLLGGLVMLAAVIGLYVVTTRDESPFASGTFDFRAIASAANSGELGVGRGAQRLVPRIHVRVRGESTALAAAQLVAGLRGGIDSVDSSVDDGGRGQGGHVRDDSLLPATVPGVVVDLCTVDHHARRYRDRLRRNTGDRANRRHETDRLHVDFALRLHHSRNLRDDQPEPGGFRAVHGQSRESPLRLCS